MGKAVIMFFIVLVIGSFLLVLMSLKEHEINQDAKRLQFNVSEENEGRQWSGIIQLKKKQVEVLTGKRLTNICEDKITLRYPIRDGVGKTLFMKMNKTILINETYIEQYRIKRSDGIEENITFEDRDKEGRLFQEKCLQTRGTGWDIKWK